jgi:hypothetical protein
MLLTWTFQSEAAANHAAAYALFKTALAQTDFPAAIAITDSGVIFSVVAG